MNQKPERSETVSVKSLRKARYRIPYPQAPEVQQSQKRMLDSNRVVGWITIGVLSGVTVGAVVLLYLVMSLFVFTR